MRLVVIHPAKNGYSVYEGRKCLGGFTADRPLTRQEVEALRTVPQIK